MSHRTRRNDPLAVLPVTTYAQLPQIHKTSRLPAREPSTASQRLSMTSNSSAGRRSSTSLDNVSASTRPSGIPRPAKKTSSTRLDVLSTVRPAVNYSYRPKVAPNITGIANRTNMRNRSTERATPINNTPRIVTDEDLMSLEPTIPSFDMDHETVFGVALPYKKPPPSMDLPPRLIPELQALAASSQRRPTPAMSTISTISSPSTQFTTSPSPWSASTTTTTPTSWSSASPSVLQPIRAQAVSKRSQTVPIPSSVRTAMPKLPALKESGPNLGPSPKQSGNTEDSATPKKVKKKTPRNSPAPTPPPRTSSAKRGRSRSNSKTEEDTHLGREEVPPVPYDLDISPVERHVKEAANRSEQISQTKALTDNHKKLQDAINCPPPRPSRNGTDDLNILRPQMVFATRSRHDEQARQLLDAAPIEHLSQSTSKQSLELNAPSEPEPPMPPQPSRSRLGKFSKLAFFGRSPKKTPSETDSTLQPRKLQRRGPTAGTGHEGYSRFGRKDRRTSTDGHTTGTDSESSVVSTRRKPLRSSSSNERSVSARRDRASQSDLDDFTASRLKPVVIVGGSRRVSSSLDSNPVHAPAPVNANPVVEQGSNDYEQSRHPSVTSSGPLMRESRLMFHLDSLDAQDQPRLALRRSQKFNNPDLFRIPEPISTDLYPHPPYLSGYNSSQSSIVPTSAALTEISHDLHRTESIVSDKSKKKGRKLNWGFFKRKESTTEMDRPRTAGRNVAPAMAVRISAVPPPRPMPYYAMLESENESANPQGNEEFLAEMAQTMPSDEDEDPISPLDEFEAETVTVERAHSVLLPSAPLLRQRIESPQLTVASPAIFEMKSHMTLPTPLVTAPRRPRLPQVGRIPKVVPTTQMSVPGQLSSSLPSSGLAMLEGRYALNYAQTVAEPARPAKPTGSERVPKPDVREKLEPVNTSSRAEIEHGGTANYVYSREYLKLPDRYSTTSSSSDGVVSVMGPPLLPAPEFPVRNIRYTTSEDDVWNEYDDFIDGMISPPRLRKSAMRVTNEDRVRPLLSQQHISLQRDKPPSKKASKGLAVNTSLFPLPLLSRSPIPYSGSEDDLDFQLRRSRIISALHSSMDPSSPFSIGDYLAELGEPRRNSGRTSGRLSDSTISQAGIRSPKTTFAFPEPPTTQPEYRHYENAVHMDEVKRSKDPARYSEGSYASLMVSRWLSFGRVLFSPAHADLQKQPDRHVLVIDGLGNEDWSIYCAVTYSPEQALVYDLKETGHTRSSTSPTKGGHTPPNFRRRELSSFNDVFKFPDNFFSVIVLRFPPVMAESKLKNIISECRRVLAPGAHIELVLLELDIVNMGVVTRRAMRNLKTQIAMRNREVSLKPVIDNVQSALGENGFSKLSKCVVGVPVVGKPAGADSPASSRSSETSDRLRNSPTSGPRSGKGPQREHHHNFSLNDLVADHSENADAKISRAVSRTARSWWQHCFEAAVISDGNLAKSILTDKAVLSECKGRASSFKLLIAHAQKPSGSGPGAKRRTMSEPVIATLATAGTP